ncbi:Hypothetical predicted protein [Pelobates cultripes]|uniref:Uncharacterized protein n=1 Tax=Pelobates cultripes TaxID=61616 RepID=A0AAD1VJV1_PELCU|nr:Hypothetical predicted protein [Pelobates cultripes]
MSDFLQQVIHPDFRSEDVANVFSNKPLGNLNSDSNDINQAFFAIQKLYQTQLRGFWELASLRHYIEQKLVPRGLRPDILLPDKVKTEEQVAEWNSILLDCSAKIMQFLIKLEQESLEKTNGDLDTEIKKIKTFEKEPEFIAMETKLEKNLENFKRNIRHKKHYKFQRDFKDFQEGNIFKNKNKTRRDFRNNRLGKKGFSSSDETEWSESETRPRFNKRPLPKKTQYTSTVQTRGILRNTDRNISFSDPPAFGPTSDSNPRQEAPSGSSQSSSTFLDQEWPQPQRARLRDRKKWGYKIHQSNFQ